ncbi:MAG: ATP-binding protein [Bacteroidota bacterium]|nr:ATP-binding protein [Bacteroidota bacterium]
MKSSLPVKILLVEDDEDDYIIIRDFLSDTSIEFEIKWVTNYFSFLDHLKEQVFDLVITDYLLGNTSGLEVLKTVKAFNPVLPVMVLTGKGNTAIDMEAMTLGASDYLVKGSFDSSSLERAIRYVLERANSARILKENEHYQSTINKLVSTDRIAKMIAHEVKNPLTNILLSAEQLRNTFQENSEVLSYIEIITRNSKRINQLVRNLLDSTRFGDVNLKKINLIEVIRDTLTMAHDRIQFNSIRLIENYSDPVFELELDEEKMKIALLNIIINSIEALEENTGVIELKVMKVKGNIKIHISDNGPGISEEAKERLFEPFFTSKPKGTGLGLSSVQSIILSHRGKIEVKSNTGTGAEFIISLPL